MRLHAMLAALALTGCGAMQRPMPFDQVDADPVRHGERLTAVLGCKGCHGEQLSGEDWGDPGFSVMRTANLTISAQRYSAAGLKSMIVSGKRPGGRELWDMPSYLFANLPDRDLDAIVAYLKTLKPVGKAAPEPVFLAPARKEMAEGTYRSAAAEVRASAAKLGPDAGPQFARGRMIVRATCAECHRIDLDGSPSYPGEPPKPDLRIVAAYGKADFLKFLVTGKAQGNRELEMMSNVARGRFAHMTDPEREAVHAYLEAVCIQAAAPTP